MTHSFDITNTSIKFVSISVASLTSLSNPIMEYITPYLKTPQTLTQHTEPPTMAPPDDWRPYTIPYSGDGAVKRSDGTWVPSSKAHTTPLVLAPQQPSSSADTPPAPPPAMDTSATAANDAGFDSDRVYTATGFLGGPDIPSLPAQSPFTQVGHPRFAAEKGPGDGIPCTGGNPPAGCFGKGQRGSENSQNAQDEQVKGGK